VRTRLRRQAWPFLVVVAALGALEAGTSGIPGEIVVSTTLPAVDRPIAADHSGSIVVDVPFIIRGPSRYGSHVRPYALVLATADGHPRGISISSGVPRRTISGIKRHPFYSGLVAAETGRPITPVESVARNLLRIVDQLPAFYAVGIASVLLSKQGKRLGDFVAGTIVVHERALQDVKPLWQPAQGAAPLSFGSQQISGEDLSLIEAFLNRREALEPVVRFRMAEQILARLRPRLSLAADNSLTGEILLEAIARERRSSAGYS